jgi:hypothetical protein
MGTVAAIISASLSDIGVGEKVMVLLLLLASCLALAVAATLVALVALGVAMPAALLLLCLEWLLPTSMRSPNTATASLTDRNGRAVSTSARSEAAAMPEQAANDKDYGLSFKGSVVNRTADSTSCLEEYMEAGEEGVFASTSIAHWPVSTSFQATSFPTATSKDDDLPPKRSPRELRNKPGAEFCRSAAEAASMLFGHSWLAIQADHGNNLCQISHRITVVA